MNSPAPRRLTAAQTERLIADLTYVIRGSRRDDARIAELLERHGASAPSGTREFLRDLQNALYWMGVTADQRDRHRANERALGLAYVIAAPLSGPSRASHSYDEAQVRNLLTRLTVTDEFLCRGCGREEPVCSASACRDVVADRLA